MRYKVELEFFQDEECGTYGLAPKNSIEYGFNALWGAQGIFHDVFEHYFEDKHKYFNKNYKSNIGGEITAMGHYYYIINKFDLSNRFFSPHIITLAESTLSNTLYVMRDILFGEYSRFGYELLCKVPKQKFVTDYRLEHIIKEHYNRFKKTEIEIEDEQQKEIAKKFKNSVTQSKLKNLYTWDYKQAQKRFPYTSNNYNTLNEFLEFWGKFCKNNNAEDLMNNFKDIIFYIKTGKEMKWSAYLISKNGYKFKINKYFDLYDYLNKLYKNSTTNKIIKNLNL